MGMWRHILAALGIGRRRRERHALQSMLSGYRASALLYAAARLGLADLMEAGPRTSAELAAFVGAQAPSLHRLLRALVVLGVCCEGPDGRFSLTPMGALLRERAPRSLRGAALLSGEEYYPAWGDLARSVMTGQPAFERVFGMSQWEHRARHPQLDESFNASLESGAKRPTGAILSAYDFSRFSTVADVGGGHGVLLAAILKAHPALSGILADQPHVVEAGRAYLEEAGVAARCRIEGGSFFEAAPDGADLHVLKSVIHDWDDERALAILKSCRRALAADGRLLLIERLLPERAREDAGTVMLDVHMLVVTGGRERTIQEHRALLEAAGFRLERVIPTQSRLRILEAAPL